VRATGRRWVARRAPAGALSAAVLTVAVLTVACRGTEPPSAPPEGSRAVSFPSADGVRLAGRLIGEGSVAVVLSHMRPADQRSWWPFSEDLAEAGYLVLTYDFRGYCPGGVGGCSAGERDLGEIWRDVLGAIDFVRSRGARRVVLIGASMGGTASLVAAAQEGVSVDAVITLSAPASFEGMDLTPDVLTRVSAAKLFIAGTGDGQAAPDAERLYDLSPPPKRVEILTTDAHGTDILSSNQAGRARTLILQYLEQVAPP
jgi:pimeloyl-ACP methyl ester carboxylesterase